LFSELEEFIDEPIAAKTRIAGGDICEAYQLVTASGQIYFAKFHNGVFAKQMFEAESLGLSMIRDSGFITPQVILSTKHYLVLEWIDTYEHTTVNWENFGERLTLLHSENNTQFGCKLDGYIGPVLQNNAWTDDFYAFYINQRIDPLFKSCYSQKLLLQKDYKYYESIVSKIERLIPDEQPVLIHGDLWSGNYLIKQNGLAVLIDPASSYNHRGFDLGMMRLFGGFSDILFSSYKERLPISNELMESLDLFQLYYLLIHLKLFGNAYYHSVSSILQKYS
jgi:fructosamine-3-kinase